jgi:hypothetical protein
MEWRDAMVDQGTISGMGTVEPSGEKTRKDREDTGIAGTSRKLGEGSFGDWATVGGGELCFGTERAVQRPGNLHGTVDGMGTVSSGTPLASRCGTAGWNGEAGGGGSLPGRLTLDFADGRRAILLTVDEAGFGKDRPSKNPAVDIPLRVIPCRSQQMDAENWARTMKLSHCHGRIRLQADGAFILDTSSNGVYLQGGTMPQTLDSGSVGDFAGTVSESGGDEGGQASWQRIPAGKWIPLRDSQEFSLGKDILRLAVRVFRSRDGKSTACVVERRSNAPSLCYVLVREQVEVSGDDPTAGLVLVREDGGGFGFRLRPGAASVPHPPAGTPGVREFLLAGERLTVRETVEDDYFPER